MRWSASAQDAKQDPVGCSCVLPNLTIFTVLAESCFFSIYSSIIFTIHITPPPLQLKTSIMSLHLYYFIFPFTQGILPFNNSTTPARTPESIAFLHPTHSTVHNLTLECRLCSPSSLETSSFP